MKTYAVRLKAYSIYEFEVEADSPEDAEDAALDFYASSGEFDAVIAETGVKVIECEEEAEEE